MFEKIYKFLNREGAERVCTDITEEACKEVPDNFFLSILSSVFAKLGDTLSNPKTVLTWLMTYVQAPVYLISLIVPIRESGSMIPQIALAKYLNKQRVKKWFWIVGAVLQFAAIAAVGFIGIGFNGAFAGWLILMAIIIYSLARSVSSLTSKDVMGKTIPKTRRGRLNGYTVAVSGILALLAGLFIMYKSKRTDSVAFYSGIVFFASATWLIAALIYSRIKEFPSDPVVVPDEKNGVLSRLRLLKTDMKLRNFVIARSLLLCSGLTAPYYVLLAQKYVGNTSYLLGLFIISNGIADIISAPIWGKQADKSSKNVMTVAVLIAATLGILTFFIISYFDTFRTMGWIYPVAFFILGIAHGGVRLGRKTYVVDMATGSDRTDYVSVSNSLIGIILLFTGGLSALISLFSIQGVILFLSLFGLLGAYRSYHLPNVENLD